MILTNIPQPFRSAILLLDGRRCVYKRRVFSAWFVSMQVEKLVNIYIKMLLVLLEVCFEQQFDILFLNLSSCFALVSHTIKKIVKIKNTILTFQQRSRLIYIIVICWTITSQLLHHYFHNYKQWKMAYHDFHNYKQWTMACIQQPLLYAHLILKTQYNNKIHSSALESVSTRDEITVIRGRERGQLT